RRHRGDRLRPARDAPARDLLRDDHDRDRAAALFRRGALEQRDRGRGRPRGLRAPAAAFPGLGLRHPQRDEIFLRGARLLHGGRDPHAHAARLAPGPHLGRDPREPAPRAVPRRARGPLRLGRVRDLGDLHGPRRGAERAPLQLHLAAGPALDPLGRLRDHDRAGRHAQFLGPAPRGAHLHLRAGLPLERHRQLDDLHRAALRGHRAAIPARHPRAAAPAREGGRVSLLRLDSVSRHFGKLQAVQDVSFAMDAGELRAIIGPNGAGKTTFFNLITGFVPPTSGDVWFDGESIRDKPVVYRVRKGIVRTFQITEVFPDLSVYENVRFGVETAQGVNGRPWLPRDKRTAIARRTDELIEVVGLAAKADRVVSELAHGDQRVVEIAVALTMNPRLLLLDEPTAGMGAAETDHMVNLIRRLHSERGLSILFIEHDMQIVFGIAQKITVLDRGRLLAEGTPAEVSANEAVRAAYLGEEAKA